MTLLMTVSLLILSNVFMTVAWYGHLRFMSLPLWVAVIASWGIAFMEYCFQVPANRIGYHSLSAYHLKTIQEIITLTVFIVFAQVYLGEGLKPKHMAGFVLLALAAWTIFQNEYGFGLVSTDGAAMASPHPAHRLKSRAREAMGIV